MKVKFLIALGGLLLSLIPLHAQNVMEISYKDASTPATMLQLTDIGKLWFANEMLQVRGQSAPSQITQLALSGISSIKFKNSQTDVKLPNVMAADDYTVFDLQGRKVLVTRSMSAVNTLPHGVYVVRSNNKTIKISK